MNEPNVKNDWNENRAPDFPPFNHSKAESYLFTLLFYEKWLIHEDFNSKTS